MQSRFRDWGDVRLFLAVARRGSTLAASREFGLTQTTVARRIDGLEHALGVKLFDRDTRGYQLTPEGSALVKPAEALEAAAGAFADEAMQQTRTLDRPIRFTAWENAMNPDMAKIFADFTQGTAGVVFEFLASEKPLDLAAGEADVALRLSSRIGDPSLICRRVGTAYWTYYASRRYAATHGTPSSMDDPMDDHTVALLRHVPTRRKHVISCDNVAELLMAIHSGRAIGPIMTSQADSDPGLVRCFAPPPGSDFPVWLLASPAAYRRPEVRRFTAFAAPRFARYLKERAPAP